MTFHKIVREWCRSYKYMLDSPDNRRFYLTDSQAGVVELAKGATRMLSPCVVMESSVEGDGTLTKPSRNYPIYFFVKAEKMADGDAAAEAKELAWMHARDFLTWLRWKHERETETNTNGDFARIDVDNAYLMFTTVGPLEDGWYGVLVQLDRMEPLDLCIDPNLYDDGCCCR
jgi:hypothetical protein